MTGVTTTSRTAFLIAFATACLGAVGQAYLLYHELSDCYPYKIMSFPPAEFYQRIADVGLFLAPLVAALSGIYFGLKKIWLAGILPVSLCPLVFCGVFVTLTLLRGWSDMAGTGRNLDDTDPLVVGLGFLSYAAKLALIGSGVGIFSTYLTVQNFERWNRLKEFVRNL